MSIAMKPIGPQGGGPSRPCCCCCSCSPSPSVSWLAAAFLASLLASLTARFRSLSMSLVLMTLSLRMALLLSPASWATWMASSVVLGVNVQYSPAEAATTHGNKRVNDGVMV